jgi:hypothetical protein
VITIESDRVIQTDSLKTQFIENICPITKGLSEIWINRDRPIVVIDRTAFIT